MYHQFIAALVQGFYTYTYSTSCMGMAYRPAEICTHLNQGHISTHPIHFPLLALHTHFAQKTLTTITAALLDIELSGTVPFFLL